MPTSDNSLVTVGNLKRFTRKAGTSYSLANFLTFTGDRTIYQPVLNIWDLAPDNDVQAAYRTYLLSVAKAMTNNTEAVKGCGNSLGLLAYNGSTNEYWPLQGAVCNNLGGELWFNMPPSFSKQRLIMFNDEDTNNFIPKLLCLQVTTDVCNAYMFTPSAEVTDSSTLTFNGTVKVDLTLNGLLNYVIG